MDIIKLDQLLEKAHSLFLNSQFDKALFLYSQVSYTNPNSKEYQVYPLLCDIGYDNGAKALELFDYFIINKDIDLKKAIEYIYKQIETYDVDHDFITKMMNDISIQAFETINAIEYKDFLELERSRGSFKRAYEDIMFSTKVAISSKDDLVDFITKLIENGFDTTAYSYLDGFNEIFSYDKDLTNLYQKLQSKNIDNN